LSFKANHPNANVLTADANMLLDKILCQGEGGDDEDGSEYPAIVRHYCRCTADFCQGEVEAIVAGCPCQGFSFLNQFADTEPSLRNDLNVLTFLSFVETYRPEFVLFENVVYGSLLLHSKHCRNIKRMIRFPKGKGVDFFALIVRALVHLGYQVGFGFMTAAQHGLPQRRNRIFIWALGNSLCFGSSCSCSSWHGDVTNSYADALSTSKAAWAPPSQNYDTS
jgi:DNA (cytosine-5)-methyltransferase 1